MTKSQLDFLGNFLQVGTVASPCVGKYSIIDYSDPSSKSSATEIYLRELADSSVSTESSVEYSELVFSALDILRIEQIISSTAEINDDSIWEKISSNTASLHVHSGSIRTSFPKFPWEDPECVWQGGLQDVSFRGNLPELCAELKQIIVSYVGENPDIKALLPAEVNERIESYSVEATGSLSTVVSVDRSLSDIRKVTEPHLDKKIQEEVLSIIERVKTFNINDTSPDGKFALLASIWMIGEATKKLSIQTKLLDANLEVPFRALKAFRDDMHSLISRVTSAKNLFPFIDENTDLFVAIRDYIIGDLRTMFTNMEIATDLQLSEKFWRFNNSLRESEKQEIIEAVKEFLLEDGSLDDVIETTLAAVSLILCERKIYDSSTNLYRALKDGISDNIGCEIQMKGITSRVSREVKKKISKIKIKESDAAPIPSIAVECFEQFKDNLWSNKGEERSKKRASDEVKVKVKLQLMLQFLEQIMLSTEALVSSCGLERDLFNNSEFHFSHLCHLMIIGECRRDLMSMDLFSNYADIDILKEFEFLRWVRNALAHGDEIDQADSTFSLFSNDLVANVNIRASGISAYDSREYYSYMQRKVATLLENLRTGKNKVDQDSVKSEFYIYLMLEELKKEHQLALDKEGATVSQRIIIAQLKKLGVLEGLEHKDKDSDEEYYDVKEILCKKLYLDIGIIIENKDELSKLALFYEVNLVSILGYAVEYIDIIDNGGEIVFIVDTSNPAGLVGFKKACRKLLKYKVAIVTEDECKEYFTINIEDSAEKESKEQQLKEYIKTHEFMPVINAIRLHKLIETHADIVKMCLM